MDNILGSLWSGTERAGMEGGNGNGFLGWPGILKLRTQDLLIPVTILHTYSRTKSPIDLVLAERLGSLFFFNPTAAGRWREITLTITPVLDHAMTSHGGHYKNSSSSKD